MGTPAMATAPELTTQSDPFEALASAEADYQKHAGAGQSPVEPDEFEKLLQAEEDEKAVSMTSEIGIHPSTDPSYLRQIVPSLKSKELKTATDPDSAKRLDYRYGKIGTEVEKAYRDQIEKLATDPNYDAVRTHAQHAMMAGGISQGNIAEYGRQLQDTGIDDITGYAKGKLEEAKAVYKRRFQLFGNAKKHSKDSHGVGEAIKEAVVTGLGVLPAVQGGVYAAENLIKATPGKGKEQTDLQKYHEQELLGTGSRIRQSVNDMAIQTVRGISDFFSSDSGVMLDDAELEKRLHEDSAIQRDVIENGPSPDLIAKLKESGQAPSNWMSWMRFGKAPDVDPLEDRSQAIAGAPVTVALMKGMSATGKLPGVRQAAGMANRAVGWTGKKIFTGAENALKSGTARVGGMVAAGQAGMHALPAGIAAATGAAVTAGVVRPVAAWVAKGLKKASEFVETAGKEMTDSTLRGAASIPRAAVPAVLNRGVKAAAQSVVEAAPFSIREDPEETLNAFVTNYMLGMAMPIAGSLKEPWNRKLQTEGAFHLKRTIGAEGAREYVKDPDAIEGEAKLTAQQRDYINAARGFLGGTKGANGEPTQILTFTEDGFVQRVQRAQEEAGQQPQSAEHIKNQAGFTTDDGSAIFLNTNAMATGHEVGHVARILADKIGLLSERSLTDSLNESFPDTPEGTAELRKFMVDLGYGEMKDLSDAAFRAKAQDEFMAETARKLTQGYGFGKLSMPKSAQERFSNAIRDWKTKLPWFKDGKGDVMTGDRKAGTREVHDISKNMAQMLRDFHEVANTTTIDPLFESKSDGKPTPEQGIKVNTTDAAGASADVQARQEAASILAALHGWKAADINKAVGEAQGGTASEIVSSVLKKYEEAVRPGSRKPPTAQPAKPAADPAKPLAGVPPVQQQAPTPQPAATGGLSGVKPGQPAVTGDTIQSLITERNRLVAQELPRHQSGTNGHSSVTARIMELDNQIIREQSARNEGFEWDENGKLVQKKTATAIQEPPLAGVPPAQQQAPAPQPAASLAEVKPAAAQPHPTRVTQEHFKDKSKFYRVVVGDEAFTDIVDSGVVRSKAKPLGEAGKIILAGRPTAFPSFSKGEASTSYAKANPNHYIIETADPSMGVSKRGRHGKGTTHFPMDAEGNPVASLGGEKVRVYKHTGDGGYELVYADGKAVTPTSRISKSGQLPLDIGGFGRKPDRAQPPLPLAPVRPVEEPQPARSYPHTKKQVAKLTADADAAARATGGDDVAARTARVDALLKESENLGEEHGLRRYINEDGDTLIRGDFDPQNPLHRALAEEANLSPEQFDKLAEVQAANKSRETLSITHDSKQTEGAKDATGEEAAARKKEYQGVARASAKKNLVPIYTEFKLGRTKKKGVEVGPSIQVGGVSTDKILQNLDIVRRAVAESPELASKYDLTNLDDSRARKIVEMIGENYRNGYTARGDVLDTGVEGAKPSSFNAEYTPHKVGEKYSEQEFQAVNAAFADNRATTAPRKPSTVADKARITGLAEKNNPHFAGGETNPLRDALEAGGHELKKRLMPTFENINARDILEVHGTREPGLPGDADQIVRDSGGKAVLDLSNINPDYTAGGFMPKSEIHEGHEIKKEGFFGRFSVYNPDGTKVTKTYGSIDQAKAAITADREGWFAHGDGKQNQVWPTIELDAVDQFGRKFRHVNLGSGVSAIDIYSKDGKKIASGLRHMTEARLFLEKHDPENAGTKIKLNFDPDFRGIKPPETKQFKEWFSGSKVINESGTPIAVFHGTSSQGVHEFSGKKDRRGFFGKITGINPDEFNALTTGKTWFTSSPTLAGEYANATRGEGNTPNIIPVFLSIKKPIVIDAKKGEITHADGSVEKVDILSNDWKYTNKTGLELAKKEGADGVIIKGGLDAPSTVSLSVESDIYITFRPEQIKSALGNSGAFDPSNPDIRFMPKGETTNEKTPTAKRGLAGFGTQTTQEKQGARPGARAARPEAVPDDHGGTGSVKIGNTNVARSLTYDVRNDPLGLVDEAAKKGGSPDAIAKEVTRLARDYGFAAVHDSVSGHGATVHDFTGDVTPESFAKSHAGHAIRVPEMVAEIRRATPDFDKIPSDYFEQKPADAAQITKQNLISKDYEALKSDNLGNKEVAEAYLRLNKALAGQFRDVLGHIDVEPWTGEGQPYKTSREMQHDMRHNKHLFVFTTEPGAFGSSDNYTQRHPLLRDSGFKSKSGFKFVFNDILRAVHDAIAHGAFGVQFGPHGEEAAWRAHMATIQDPLARRALTTETRGQNSWVNFRDQYLKDGRPLKPGEEGYVAPPERPFADQKADLLPEKWALTGDATVDAVMKKESTGPLSKFMPFAGESAKGFDEAKRRGLVFANPNDKRARFEVPGAFSMNPEASKKLMAGKKVAAGELVKDYALFEQYPELADLAITVKSFGPQFGRASFNGDYDPVKGKFSRGAGISINSDMLPSTDRRSGEIAQTEAIIKLLNHEFQHGVQEREGHAMGSSPEMEAWLAEGENTKLAKAWAASPDTKAAISENNRMKARLETLSRQLVNLPWIVGPETPQEISRQEASQKKAQDIRDEIQSIANRSKEINRQIEKSKPKDTRITHDEAMDRYKRSAGEIEANVASARALLSEKELAKEKPDFSGPGGKPIVRTRGDLSSFMPKKSSPIESDEFKSWFGDWTDKYAWSSKGTKGPVSMVMDWKTKKPMVVYHTTVSPENFSTFETGRPTKDSWALGDMDTNRHAIFFTDNPKFSNEYAEDGNGGFQKNARTMPTYLSIKSPLDLTKSFDAYELGEEIGINPKWIANMQNHWELFDGEGGRKFVEALKKNGYDGAIFHENDSSRENTMTTYAVFDSKNAKSAIGNSGAFDPSNPDTRFMPKQAEEKSEPFYSQLTRTVKGLPQDTMTVAQARAAIEKGSKKAEQELSGIFTDPLSPLAGKQPGEKVTKEELTSYAIERQAKVQDVTLGGEIEPSKGMRDFLRSHAYFKDTPIERMGARTWRDVAETLNERGRALDDIEKHSDESDRAYALGKEARQLERQSEGGKSAKASTQFEGWQMPGADEGSYREMFGTWPEQKNSKLTDSEQKEMDAILEKERREGGLGMADDIRFNDLKKKQEGGTWNDGHSQYSDIKNPIFRVRRNIRTVPIESIRESHPEVYSKLNDEGKTTARLYFMEEIQLPNPENQAKAPKEIFKGSRGYEIGMKRALRDAVDEGADAIAWTTGEQQAERYDLRKNVDRILVSGTLDGKYQAHVTERGGTIGVERGGSMDAKQLADTIGKELAKQAIDKISASPEPQYETAEFTGEGLKVGGEGLKRLYDETLPRIANELAKKFGVKVSSSKINQGRQPRLEMLEAKKDGEYVVRNKDTGEFSTGLVEEKWSADEYDAESYSPEEARNFIQEFKNQRAEKEVHSLAIPDALREQQRGGNALFMPKGNSENLDVDKGGKKILYHGTTDKKSGPRDMMFLSEDPDFAKEYTKVKGGRTGELSDSGAVKKFAVSAEKPFTVGKDSLPGIEIESWSDLTSEINNNEVEIVSALKKNGYDSARDPQTGAWLVLDSKNISERPESAPSSPQVGSLKDNGKLSGFMPKSKGDELPENYRDLRGDALGAMPKGWKIEKDGKHWTVYDENGDYVTREIDRKFAVEDARSEARDRGIELPEMGEVANFMPKSASEAGAEMSPRQEKKFAAQQWAEKGTDSEYFKSWFGGSKVVGEDGKALRVFSGHGNAQLYGNKYDPRKGTAGGFYATEDAKIASNYSEGKIGGARENYERGSQYRFKLKNGELGKKLWQMELTPEQVGKAREFLESEDGINTDLVEYAEKNAPYDATASRLKYRGLKDLQSVHDIMEMLGYNIAYSKSDPTGTKMPAELQTKNSFEEMLDHVGIEWDSHEWRRPGVMPLYLKIENPLDASQPFPQDLLAALKKTAARGREQAWASEAHWTKDYSLKDWVKEIEEGNEYWTTHIPAKALPIIKSFGYDGIKELGLKGETDRAKRQINWIAFDPEQIKSATGNSGKFDSENPDMRFMPKQEDFELPQETTPSREAAIVAGLNDDSYEMRQSYHKSAIVPIIGDAGRKLANSLGLDLHSDGEAVGSYVENGKLDHNPLEIIRLDGLKKEGRLIVPEDVPKIEAFASAVGKALDQHSVGWSNVVEKGNPESADGVFLIPEGGRKLTIDETHELITQLSKRLGIPEEDVAVINDTIGARVVNFSGNHEAFAKAVEEIGASLFNYEVVDIGSQGNLIYAKDYEGKIQGHTNTQSGAGSHSFQTAASDLRRAVAEQVREWSQKNAKSYTPKGDLAEFRTNPEVVTSRVSELPEGGKYMPKAKGDEGQASLFSDAQRNRDLRGYERKKERLTEQNFPEAIPVEYQRKEGGGFKTDKKGKPKPVEITYELNNTPLAKDAMNGVRGEVERRESMIGAYSKKLTGMFNKIKNNPAIMAGKQWYSDYRKLATKLLGDDADVFAQFLAATSARTPVLDNFRQAIEALNLMKTEQYQAAAKRYLELEMHMEDGSLQFRRTTKDNNAGDLVTPKNFKDYLDAERVLPRKKNGAKFNANSMQVLQVMAGVWLDRVKGPKTPNFHGNLIGTSIQATIDVWAARTLHRLGSEAAGGQWRILPESETGVTDADFKIGQEAYAKAAEELGMTPMDLQGALWFAEKDYWDGKKWTGKAGAEKGDFRSLLEQTKKEDGRQVFRPKDDKQLDLSGFGG